MNNLSWFTDTGISSIHIGESDVFSVPTYGMIISRCLAMIQIVTINIYTNSKFNNGKHFNTLIVGERKDKLQ